MFMCVCIFVCLNLFLSVSLGVCVCLRVRLCMHACMYLCVCVPLVFVLVRPLCIKTTATHTRCINQPSISVTVNQYHCKATACTCAMSKPRPIHLDSKSFVLTVGAVTAVT